MGPLLFLFYTSINDLPKIIHYNFKSTLFADDTSLIFCNPNYLDLKPTINNVFPQLNEWFDDNLLLLNYEKNSIYPFYSQRYCSS